MNLTFRNPGLQYSIDSILMFQTEDQSDWWRDTLFHFYPELDRKVFDSLDQTKREEYLRDCLSQIYEKKKTEIEEKLHSYQEQWDQNRSQVEEALEEAFGVSLKDGLNDLTVNVSMNPISPRFLEEHTFDVFYLNSEKGALGLSLHELIHFVWFLVWNGHFKDSYEEYECPSLKWVVSEMVVDTIMRDERLSSINPYFSEGGCVYDYFYQMTIEGKVILDTLYECFKQNSMEEFMEKSYQYCKNHEKEIRKQMK